jgi:hypothetical protein
MKALAAGGNEPDIETFLGEKSRCPGVSRNSGSCSKKPREEGGGDKENTSGTRILIEPQNLEQTAGHK